MKQLTRLLLLVAIAAPLASAQTYFVTVAGLGGESDYAGGHQQSRSTGVHRALQGRGRRTKRGQYVVVGADRVTG